MEKYKLDYKIVISKNQYTFHHEVEKELNNGWELVGGVSQTLTQPSGYLNMQDIQYAQALTKKTKDW